MPEYELKMKVTVYKIVTVKCESEEEAISDPWKNCTDDREIDMVDWEVQSIVCTEKE